MNILNVRVDDITQQELLEQLNEGVLVTPNVDDIMKHQHDKEFHKMASKAEFSVCDSKILLLSSKFLGKGLREAIPGSSFFPKYCEYHAKDENIKVFLLGAKEGVAAKAAKNINNKIGRNIIVGTYSPPFGFERKKEECQKIITEISKTDATVVLVGLGNPKQTKWIYKYKDKLPQINLYLALGATIDFEAGNIKRAPKIFQKLALEWIYRMCKDPKRLVRRYLIEDMPFFYYLALQLLGLYKDPFAEK